MKYIFIIFFSLSLWSSTYQLDLKNIIFVILSQENSYHENLADNLKEDIFQQAVQLNQEPPGVKFLHKDFRHIGGWTILPIIPEIIEQLEENILWIIFCQDVTRFNIQNLLKAISKYDSKEEIWLGHGLQDREATIIHHFAFFNDPKVFLYPNFSSGFVISISLLKSLEQRIETIYNNDVDFAIDASHELALFIWDNENGPTLINETSLCVDRASHCASYVQSFIECENSILNENIIFAVKTCKKHHEDRVPIVKKTWGKYVKHIYFYSEEKDESIPTTVLKVPNTERGHCGKTLGILHHVAELIKNNQKISWVIITDDDTILSPSHLQKILSCYNAKSDVALGERYGFRVYYHQGYNYVTGGGGMVFSAPLVQQLTQPGVCKCPSNQSPDDMFLGVCLFRLGINITHSPAFHQARPNDYAVDYLASHKIVSFHKHWMVNPESVYQKWFAEDDSKFSELNTHEEL